MTEEIIVNEDDNEVLDLTQTLDDLSASIDCHTEILEELINSIDSLVTVIENMQNSLKH